MHLLKYLLNETKTGLDKKKLVYQLGRAAFLCDECRIINCCWWGLAGPKEWLSREDLQDRISLWLPSGNWFSLLKSLVEFDFDIVEDFSCLEGVCIHEVYGKIPGYHFVDKDTLELQPADRLRQLFTIESEWTQEDIVPFIKFVLFFYNDD